MEEQIAEISSLMEGLMEGQMADIRSLMEEVTAEIRSGFEKMEERIKKYQMATEARLALGKSNATSKSNQSPHQSLFVDASTSSKCELGSGSSARKGP